MQQSKKYNNQTGNYKIDIFVNGCYACSTDWAKSCKAAIKRYIEINGSNEGEKITAHYYRS